MTFWMFKTKKGRFGGKELGNLCLLDFWSVSFGLLDGLGVA